MYQNRYQAAVVDVNMVGTRNRVGSRAKRMSLYTDGNCTSQEECSFECQHKLLLLSLSTCINIFVWLEQGYYPVDDCDRRGAWRDGRGPIRFINSVVRYISVKSQDTYVTQLEQRRSALNNSFALQDEAETEIRNLNKRVLNLTKALRESDSRVSALTTEVNRLCDKLNSSSTIVKNLEDLKDTQLCTIQGLSYKLDVANDQLVKLIDTNAMASPIDKWVEEESINAYIQSWTTSSEMYSNILIFDTATTQLLKMGTPESLADTLVNSKFFSCTFVFFCVNNSTDKDVANAGTHWSLILLDKANSQAYHLDSISGLNHSSALTLAKNLGILENNVLEVECPQQNNGFECGLNVLVNIKLILHYYCLSNVKKPFLEWYDMFNNKSVVSNSSELQILSDLNVSNSSCGLSDISKSASPGPGGVSRPNVIKLVKKQQSNEWYIVKPKRKSKSKFKTNKVSSSYTIEIKNKYSKLASCNSEHDHDSGSVNTLSGVWKTSLQMNGHCYNSGGSQVVKSNEGQMSVCKEANTSKGQPYRKRFSKDVLDPALPDSNVNMKKDVNIVYSNIGSVYVDRSPNIVKSAKNHKSALRGCLVIGDSLLRHSSKQCAHSGATVDINSGAKIVNIRKKLNDYIEVQPPVIYLHVGTNDVPVGYDGGPGYDGGCGKKRVESCPSNDTLIPEAPVPVVSFRGPSPALSHAPSPMRSKASSGNGTLGVQMAAT
ncbi:SUMO1 sentrin specific peptidase 8 [Homalodisca vitripennis]|nr:SUMO1 sentrin specific peptidase 8 [Homalodisca vitripennis]